MRVVLDEWGFGCSSMLRKPQLVGQD